jgi:hypothetical protein
VDFAIAADRLPFCNCLSVVVAIRRIPGLTSIFLAILVSLCLTCVTNNRNRAYNVWKMSVKP